MSPKGWFNKLLKKPQTTNSATQSLAPSSPRENTSNRPSPRPIPTNRSPESREHRTNLENSARFDAFAPTRIFALVVGINAYKSDEFPHLTGCKGDGRRFIDFLTGVLGVPQPQITFLADENATERAIVDVFNTFLIGNEHIQRDDAIVFFFAGHGTQSDAPSDWVTDNGKVEFLCPHDVQTVGADGEMMWGISDRALDKLMRRLAHAKGDNIVAIFDCCHSGGLARAVDDRDLRVRSIPPLPGRPPSHLNQAILQSHPDEPCVRAANTVIGSGFQYKAMESHVVLAACRPDESALEDPSSKDSGGLFTTALIGALRTRSFHDTSYASLFERLDLKNRKQHPQCEGAHRDRLLFSINTIRNGETTFVVFDKGGKTYVSAGSVHGVVENTEFSATTSAGETVTLKAKKVRAFDTILDCDRPIADGTAKVSRWRPTLKVHGSVSHLSTHVTVVPDDELADVAVRDVGPGQWELERLDPLIPTFSDKRMSFEANAEQMGDILDVIANFNAYLYRSDGGDASSIAGKVDMRMHRVVSPDQDVSRPVGEDLLDVERTSHSIKEAVVTDLDARYSFTLENRSEVGLFPYFFYFDPGDYSVDAWYKPTSSTEAPLKPRKRDGSPSVFAVGYGAFGTNPIEFYLPEGRTRDSGFLKVFLTTTYVDMANVVQSQVGKHKGMRGRFGHTLRGTWTCETFVMTVKQV